MNLTAQVIGSYSIDHLDMYIESNIIGFYNLLEGCRLNPVEYDIEKCKAWFDIVFANRFDGVLADVKDKIYSRDLFRRDW